MEKLTKALMTDETGQAIVTKLTALSRQMHELALATRGAPILFDAESDISVLGDGGYLAVYVGSTNPLEISEWTGDNSLVTGHLYYLIKSGTSVASSDLGEYGGTAVTSTTFTEPGVPADDFAVGQALADKADADDLTAIGERVTANESDLNGLDQRVANLEEGGGAGGITDAVKDALLALFRNVALFTSDNGQELYDDLYNALYSVSAIRLDTYAITLTGIGNTAIITATTVPEGGSVIWVSDDISVATVDQNGVVTSVGYGSANISAMSGGVTATCAVNVAQVTLSSISAEYTQTGIVYPTTSLDALISDLVVTATWSDGSTSTVTGNAYELSGTLTTGRSTVTVTYGNKTTTFNVAVSAAPSISRITAIYSQSEPVYETTSLDKLKTDLVVRAIYTDGSTVPVASEDYTLSGTLAEGTSIITVSYSGVTTTFNVEVSEPLIPSGYQQVEYVESSGQQYIAPNITLDALPIRIEVGLYKYSQAKAEEAVILNKPQSGTILEVGYISTTNTIFAYSGASARLTNPLVYKNVTDVVAEFNATSPYKTISVTANGSTFTEQSTDVNNAGITGITSLEIFGRANGSLRTAVRMYYCRIYSGGTLKMNLIPCYDKTSEIAGFYDAVGKHFYQSGGSPFAKGGDVVG